MAMLNPKRFAPLVAFSFVCAMFLSMSWQAAGAETDLTPGADGQPLLDQAAEVMADVQTFRFRLRYEEGKTTLYDRIQMTKADGAVVQPDRLKAKVTAKISPLSITLNVTAIGGRVWVDAVGVGGEVSLDSDIQRILMDPVSLVSHVIESVENPIVNRVETVDGVELVWLNGTFNPAGLADTDLDPYTRDIGLRPVEFAIDPDGHVVSLIMDGPVIEYDSDDVVRRLDFYDFDAPIEIEEP